MDPMVKIIRHIKDCKYEDLPKDVIEASKKAIIDTVGAGVGGSSAPLGVLVAEMVRSWGGGKESSLMVYGDKVPTQEAAFANGIMARCLELDDVHEGSAKRGGGVGGHVSVSIIPATLATAEASSHPISGRLLLLSIAIGGDLLVRLRLAGGKSGRLGWIAETLSPFGVVASAAKLFDLTEDVIANAMGAAYTFCSGNTLSTNDGTWDIWLAAGNGARGGIVAVDMARRGYLGSKSPLSGRVGLYPLYFRGEYDEEVLLSGLGKEFEGANVSIKPYSSCKFTHHPIYTSLELMKKHGIRTRQIEAIHVKTCTYGMELTVLNEKGEHKYTPRSLGEAQFSMPFTIATAVLRGGVFPDVLKEETIRDPEILRLSCRVKAEASAEMDEIIKRENIPPAEVEIHTVDGKVFRGCEPFVKGHPRNPMSFNDVGEKFVRCAKLSFKPIPDKVIERFLESVENLDQMDDVRNLLHGLT